ncbi:MAG: ATP-binding protein [Holosporaceae bacterium]|jgi:serine/threonine-protein kinase RsbW/sigma-B regulation protein RsbU (phosphoserine phosphatase)|nr:ATP-binding protein [Holosporaceae bacterium]
MLIEIENNIEEIDRACDLTRAFCLQHKISDEKCHDITLIVDEIMTNIIKYAYSDKQSHTFSLLMEKNDIHIAICFLDDGTEFDPLAAKTPDISSTCIEDRPIGGLGIFIVRQLAEDVKYSRVGNLNRLDIVVNV